jgi:hypothetical protein
VFEIQTDLVFSLRSMARNGVTPAEMLRVLATSLADESVTGTIDRPLLIRYFSEAFCFHDCEAHPIGGWLPDGMGELKDENIDILLGKRIEKTKDEWTKQLGPNDVSVLP